jgi:hypothetical protein
LKGGGLVKRKISKYRKLLALILALGLLGSLPLSGFSVGASAPTVPAEDLLKSDINDDGTTDILDLLIMRSDPSGEDFDWKQRWTADIDSDETVDDDDFALLKEHLLRKSWATTNVIDSFDQYEDADDFLSYCTCSGVLYGYPYTPFVALGTESQPDRRYARFGVYGGDGNGGATFDINMDGREVAFSHMEKISLWFRIAPLASYPNYTSHSCTLTLLLSGGGAISTSITIPVTGEWVNIVRPYGVFSGIGSETDVTITGYTLFFKDMSTYAEASVIEVDSISVQPLEPYVRPEGVVEDFESYTLGLPAGYATFASTGAYAGNCTLTLNAENKHSGNYGAYVNIQMQGNTSTTMTVNLAQPVSYTQNQQVSIYLKNNNLNFSDTTLDIGIVTSNGTFTETITALPEPWNKVTIWLGGAAGTITGYWMKVTKTGAGDAFRLFYFDDVTVEDSPIRAVETFEGYGGVLPDGYVTISSNNCYGSTTYLILDSNNKRSGDYGAKAHIGKKTGGGDATMTVSLPEPVAYSPNQQISTWLKNGSINFADTTVSISIIAEVDGSTVTFTKQVTALDATTWSKFIIRLGDSAGVVTGYVIKIACSASAEAWRGFYLDDITIEDSTYVRPDGVIEDFEGYPDGVLPENYAVWSDNSGAGYYPGSVEWSQVSPHSGEYCGLFRAHKPDGTSMYITRFHQMTVTLSEPVPFSGGQQVAIWLKKHNWTVLSSTGSGAEYIKLTVYTDKGNFDSDLFHTLSDQWEQRTVNLGAESGNITGYRLTVRVTDFTTPGTGVAYPRFYFDDLEVIDPS